MKMNLMGICAALFLSSAVSAKDRKDNADNEGYQFTVIREAAATPVRNQSRSGTCWSFSGIGFLESELLRTGKGEYDLSEMWVVRNAYIDKAEKYVRLHGNMNFSAGGAFHDVFNAVRKYGVVPETAYPGLGYGSDSHNHAELDAILKAYVDAVITNKAGSLGTSWMEGFKGILDAYMGPVPEKFTHDGREYTPESFTAYLGLDMDDYISLTSFTHHPFYGQFILEIPDNWAWGASYNLPLDEFMSIFDHATGNGYTICWGADVSEKGFAYLKGLAVVPEADIESMDGTEQARWVQLSDKDKEAELYALRKPGKEKVVTQQMRQEAFDNYLTTDDHGMLITGSARDQNGNIYYKVKNSWGTAQRYGGYFFASRPFVAYKTMNIVLRRNALPDAIKNKLGIHKHNLLVIEQVHHVEPAERLKFIFCQ